MKIKILKEVEAKFLDLSVSVRYDEEDMPNDAPCRNGDTWCVLIDLETKKVNGWDEGDTLSFKDMKVCDEGLYKLYDDEGDFIAEIDGYVPNSLLPGSGGDYLSLDIDKDGVVTNWLPNANLSDFEVNE